MEIIVIRGTENSGKTTSAKMAYDKLSQEADKVYLFNHYNDPINALQYNEETGDVHDFKAVISVKGKIIVVITAGDEVWRLMLNIQFLIDFILKTFKAKIDVMICCGRSHNRKGSVYMTLKEKYPLSPIKEVWVHRVNIEEKQKQKQRAVKKIVELIN